MKTNPPKYGTAKGRFAGLGPYFAMFPVPFAENVVTAFCPKGGKLLDPFCGRGTAPFMAQSNGRFALGVDSNPVAWVFAKAKTQPQKSKKKLLERIDEVWQFSNASDAKHCNEFQKWAWHPDVLQFVNSARRTLDWKNSATDWTLMGIILTSIHSKRGDGLSNQMTKSRALGPDYSVRWWKEKGMQPPKISPVSYLKGRVEWRYLHGTVSRDTPAEIILGEAEVALRNRKSGTCDLLFTSPPYLDVTSYLHDSWIRLWALGEGPARPDWRKDEKIHKLEPYRNMLEAVLAQSKRLLKQSGSVWIRTDARRATKETTREILGDLWGGRCLYSRADMPKRTQTYHYGDMTPKKGEVDFLITRSPQKAAAFGFGRQRV